MTYREAKLPVCLEDEISMLLRLDYIAHTIHARQNYGRIRNKFNNISTPAIKEPRFAEPFAQPYFLPRIDARERDDVR